jgi:hypothetical protein
LKGLNSDGENTIFFFFLSDKERNKQKKKTVRRSDYKARKKKRDDVYGVPVDLPNQLLGWLLLNIVYNERWGSVNYKAAKLSHLKSIMG